MSLLEPEWLFRPRPLPDELLSSWLVRIAWRNAVKLHVFMSENWGVRHHFWERDIDRAADIRLLHLLASKTHTQRSAVLATVLADYEGTLFEYHHVHGPINWILPIGKIGRKRYGFGQQYCPACLSCDAEPYFRRAWRLSFHVACPIHGVRMADCCPSCQSPISFHEGDYGRHTLSDVCPMVFCKHCGYDLRRTVARDVPEDVVSMVTALHQVMREGWFPLIQNQDESPVMAVPFFAGLHLIARALVSHSVNMPLAKAVSYLSGLPLPIQDADDEGKSFDLSRVDMRLRVIHMLKWLLDDWPQRFIASGKLENISSSYFLPYKAGIFAPYWYVKPLNEYLDQSRYFVTKEERQSLIAFLRRHGQPVNAFNVSKWMGRAYRVVGSFSV